MTTPIILLVEDHDKEQYVLAQILKRFDFDSHVVASGESALLELQNRQYAAVLMDVRLIGMSGLECARKIRQSEEGTSRRIPIIGISAGSEASDAADCLAAGMDDYLSKPCTIESFRRVLLRHVYDAGKPNLKTLRPVPPEEADLDVFVGESKSVSQ